ISPAASSRTRCSVSRVSVFTRAALISLTSREGGDLHRVDEWGQLVVHGPGSGRPFQDDLVALGVLSGRPLRDPGPTHRAWGEDLIVSGVDRRDDDIVLGTSNAR